MEKLADAGHEYKYDVIHMLGWKAPDVNPVVVDWRVKASKIKQQD